MMLEILLLALVASVYPVAIERSTMEADGNWKLVWPRVDERDFVQSSGSLNRDLNAFTISLWVKDLKGDTHSGYLYYTNSKNAFLLGLYRYRGNLYLQFGGVTTHCASCISYDSTWKHIVVTWSGNGASNGMGTFWVNGEKIHGHQALVQEFDIYTASYIDLDCLATNMTVYLTRTAFPHLIPGRMGLTDRECGAQFSETHVYITTNLDECGTKITYTNNTAQYSNYIVPDIFWSPANSSIDTPHAVINRGTLLVQDTSMNFHCTYPLLSHDTIPAYAVKTSNFDIDGTGRREIEFKIELYHDANYTNQFKKHEYPLRVDTGERVYVRAVVHGDNSRMAVWVDRCVGTPNPDPEAVTKHNLIVNGCPSDETVQYHNSTVEVDQRFSFESFRFNSVPSAVVYLHCFIDVCRVDNLESRCSKGLDLCPQ
ncbi:ZP domain-containing protein-like [Bolinopsis microptera]|uniref:ZP domain-containing protein-like n=1 Tax=Bolinopsis microptera TaxID=2820187 RepID=UPI003079B315